MRRSAARSLALLLLAAGASPAWAQSETDEAAPAIVVTGQRALTESEALDVVRRVARPVDGQLARFHEPICPRVTGFQTQYERMVAERIKDVAERAGADAGADGCVANFYVVIVDDGPGFVREMARKHPGVFSGVSKQEFDRLASEPGAARAWSNTVLTNSNGTPVGAPPSSAGGGVVKRGYQGSSVTIDGSVNVVRVQETSNVNPSVQQAMQSSWVVLETGATFGKTLTQLGDYAAMRGLAMVQPSELDGSEDTILGLFEPDAAVSAPELTEFDLAYLTSLYRAHPRRWARTQVRNIAEGISRQTQEGQP